MAQVCRLVNNPKVTADVPKRLQQCYGDKRHREVRLPPPPSLPPTPPPCPEVKCWPMCHDPVPPRAVHVRGQAPELSKSVCQWCVSRPDAICFGCGEAGPRDRHQQSPLNA